MLLGSVCEHIVRHAQCDVLVVHPLKPHASEALKTPETATVSPGLASSAAFSTDNAMPVGVKNDVNDDKKKENILDLRNEGSENNVDKPDNHDDPSIVHSHLAPGGSEWVSLNNPDNSPVNNPISNP